LYQIYYNHHPLPPHLYYFNKSRFSSHNSFFFRLLSHLCALFHTPRLSLPASAFAVARAAQCPVVALFVPKTGVASYRIEAVLFGAPAREDRQSAREGVRAFAEALAEFTQRHPYQCFLFADIWCQTEVEHKG